MCGTELQEVTPAFQTPAKHAAAQHATENLRASAQVEDYAAALPRECELASRPLQGFRIGLIEETMGAGVSASVSNVVEAAAAHMEGLGASVGRVSMNAFKSGLPAYCIIASSEASSNLSRYARVMHVLYH